MKNINFNNKYGSAELEVVGEYVPVCGLHSRDVPAEFKFSLDTAEQLALITENRRIQIIFEYPSMKRAFLIVHKSASIAAVARIVNLDFFSGVDAAKVLKEDRSYLAGL